MFRMCNTQCWRRSCKWFGTNKEGSYCEHEHFAVCLFFASFQLQTWLLAWLLIATDFATEYRSILGSHDQQDASHSLHTTHVRRTLSSSLHKNALLFVRTKWICIEKSQLKFSLIFSWWMAHLLYVSRIEAHMLEVCSHTGINLTESVVALDKSIC